ncbi:hypothetical protein IWX49DRAFT_571469 [Phyllosticta citricarpa]
MVSMALVCCLFDAATSNDYDTRKSDGGDGSDGKKKTSPPSSLSWYHGVQLCEGNRMQAEKQCKRRKQPGSRAGREAANPVFV